MKYIVILGDGMADYPLERLNGKTPLEVALKPNIDNLCKKGVVGLVKTVPDGMKPGSDVANLSIMGYAPQKYYSGRSPLEALSIGIDMESDDIAVRCNLVTLSDEENFYEKKMVDYSAGEISTQEAKTLIEFIQSELGNDIYRFYAGVSYRHCLIRHNAELGTELTPPHDISGICVGGYLPSGLYGKEMFELMKKAHELLKTHPINIEREKSGKNPANSIWFWGEGKKPLLDNFEEKYGVKGGVISAVDLVKGIGIGAGMEVFNVEGATGTYETNFKGKAEEAVNALKNGCDYIYIHMEAPDECGHQGDLDHKILSIELIDSLVVKYIKEEMDKSGEAYTMLITPDHPTPISLKTHVSDPVPFVLYRSDDEKDGVETYNEITAKESGLFYEDGESLAKEFIGYKGKPVQEQTESEEQPAEEINQDKVEEKEEDTSVIVHSEVQEKPAQNNVSLKPKAKEGMTKAEKKKLLIIVIASLCALVILGLGIGLPIYFTQRYNISISSSADFAKLAEKKAGDLDKYTFVLKKDVLVEGDFAIVNGVNLDLNKKSLTINGVLTINVTSEDSISIGTKKGKNYVAGGALIADSIVVNVVKKIEITSNVQAQDITIVAEETNFSAPNYTCVGNTDGTALEITSNKVDLNSNITTDNNSIVSLTSSQIFVNGGNIATKVVAAHTNFNVANGAVISELELDQNTYVTSYGNIEIINGGKIVRLLNGHSGTLYKNIQTLGIYRASDDSYTAENCDKVVYIETLAKPSDIIVFETDGKILVRMGVVKGATKYFARVDGGEWKESDTNEVDITAEIMSKTGKRKVEVRAGGNYNEDLLGGEINGEYYLYLDSEIISTNYKYTVVLEKPTNIVVNEREISFSTVNLASRYIITIDGKKHTFNATANAVTQTFDISEFVSSAGVHTIRIVAESSIDGVKKSEEAIATQVTIVKLADALLPKASVSGDKTTISWTAVDNCKTYAIYDSEGKLLVTTTATQIELSGYAGGSEFRIVSVGSGYYSSSDGIRIYSIGD